MLNAKQLTDLIIRLWAEMNPNAASLAPRESTIVYLAEELLRDHVVLHRDNWQTLETYHEWMRSVDDRLGVICAALNMLDVPRREMRGKDGKRQRIVVKIEEEEENADSNVVETTEGNVVSEESFEQHAKSVVERAMVLGATRYRIEVVAPELQRMIDHCAKIGNQLMAEHSKVSDEFDVLWESILKFSSEVCDVEEVV